MFQNIFVLKASEKIELHSVKPRAFRSTVCKRNRSCKQLCAWFGYKINNKAIEFWIVSNLYSRSNEYCKLLYYGIIMYLKIYWEKKRKIKKYIVEYQIRPNRKR